MMEADSVMKVKYMMPDVSTGQGQWEAEKLSQTGAGTEESALESENESEANAVVHNHYHEKGGHGMYGYNYGMPCIPTMPIAYGGYGGCHDGNSNWLAMMFPFMMMGMWNRGGWGAGGDCGYGFRGGDCCGVEGRLHNDMAIQTLNSEVHANALAGANATGQIMANADGNARYLNDNLFGGFANLKQGQFDLVRANDQNTSGLSRQLCETSAQNAACCCQTQREIDHSTFALSRQMDAESARAQACCCETNLNIERQGHAATLANCQQTNLLSMQHAELLNAIKQVECTVVNTSKDEALARQADEISQLRAMVAQGHVIGAVESAKDQLSKQVGCCCCNQNTALNMLGSQLATLNSPTFQWQPLNTACCC